MRKELIKVNKENKDVIFNLMQLYKYDMSAFRDDTAKIELFDNGLFDVKDLEKYWIDKKRYPYLLKYNNEIAGFVLVRFNKDNRYEVAEFFVLNIYRKSGLGRYMAEKVFKKFKGNWEVRILRKNKIAQKFWKNVISDFSNNFEEKIIRNNSRIAFYFNT